MSTSLEKSHSKSSNAKLTCICLLTALANSAAWAGLALLSFPVIPVMVAWIVFGVGLALSVLFFMMIGKFTR